MTYRVETLGGRSLTPEMSIGEAFKMRRWLREAGYQDAYVRPTQPKVVQTRFKRTLRMSEALIGNILEELEADGAL